MGKKLDMPQHSGRCGHCSTEVPLEATVCTGCGARWGTSSGKKAQDIYDEGNALFWGGIILLFIACGIAIWMRLSFNVDIEEILGLVGMGSLILVLPAIIKGSVMKYTAKNAKFSWWRKN